MPPCPQLPTVDDSIRFMIVAGEASGDHYGADLVHRILEIEPAAKFFGMGGDRMAACGVDLTHHIKEVSVMGFAEVVSRLRTLYRTFRELVAEAERRRPVAVIFIDFPDFNLRLAPKIRQVSAARTIYYIGPTVWAWRPGRIRQVRDAIDRMIVIFPFEEPLYRDAGVDVTFVGHPLVGNVKAGAGRDELCKRFGLDPDARLIALLPGSRTKEVAQILPILRAAGERLLARPEPIQLALGLAESIERAQVDALLGPDSPVRVVEHMTQDLMKQADVALVASGTAPLETAILGTPQVVVYRTTPLTFGIASRLVSVPHVCMVNLILERRAVPELIQDDLTPERLVEEATRLLDDPAARSAQIDACAELRRRLGAAGAAKRAARAVLETARSGPVDAAAEGS